MNTVEVADSWIPLAKVAAACGVPDDRVRRHAKAALAKNQPGYVQEGEHSKPRIFISAVEVERLKREVWPAAASKAMAAAS